MGFSRPDSYRNAFNNHALALANPDSAAIENIEEKASLANRLPTAGNGNPGALAGATGDIGAVYRLHAEHYSDGPATARRVDQNGNWNRARWGWMKAVAGDGNLSPMARLLASILATQFSHHETAHCAPGTKTLADALCTSVDTIKRALRDLAAAGWLIRTEGRGRGNRSEIVFLDGNNVVPMIRPREPETSGHVRSDPAKAPSERYEKGGNSAPVYNRNQAAKKGADMRGKGGKTALSYIKDDPKNIQRAGQQSKTPVSQRPNGRPDYSAYDRATARVPAPEVRNAARPVPFSRCVHPGSTAETEWNIWLAARRLPSLCQLCLRTSDAEGPGWDMPSKYPPPADDTDRTKKAEGFALWAANRPRGRSRPAEKQA